MIRKNHVKMNNHQLLMNLVIIMRGRHNEQNKNYYRSHQQAIQERQSQNKESPTFMWVHYLPPVLKSNLK